VFVTRPTDFLQPDKGCSCLGLGVRQELQVQSTKRRTWWGMRRVERIEHFEIERSGGFSDRAIQVANSRGRWLPQIQMKCGSNQGISLSGHCIGKSAVTPTLLRANAAWNVSECADVKWSAMIGKGVRRGWDGTSSLPVFQKSSQRGPCKYSCNR